MGAYATTTSLKQRYPGFPQSSTTFNTVLADNITRAEGIINSYLARRYDTPFTTVPPMVISIAEDLSASYSLRSSFMRDSHNTSQWTSALETNTMLLLEKLRSSEIDLADTSGNLISERGTRDRIKSNTEDYTPAFGLDTTTSWTVDPDRLDDTYNNRA